MIVHAGGGQVHHHHAGGGIALEVLGVLERGRRNARRQAVGRVVRQRERLVVVLHPDDRSHRPEDLVAIDGHLRGGVHEERRLEIEAFGPALEALAARGELRAFLASELDVAQVLLELLLVDDGADVGALLQRVVDLQLFHLLNQRRNEAVVDSSRDDEPARRRAALAGGEERALQRHVHRGVEVRVVEHHLRILAAHLELHLGEARRAVLRHAPPDRRGAGEANSVYVRTIREQFSDDGSSAHD